MAKGDDFFFRMYAKEILLDKEFNEMPLDAQMVLVRIWCRLCLDGSIPDDPEAIAHACCLKFKDVEVVRTHMRTLMRHLMRDASGSLRSPRMDREKADRDAKSDKARGSAKSRWANKSDANAYPNAYANRDAKTMLHSQQSTVISNPPNPQDKSGAKEVFEICQCHPDSDHYISPERIPPLLRDVVIQRLCQDGDKVKQGTAAFRKVHDEKPEDQRKFLGNDYLKAQKFFEQSRYLEFLKPVIKPASLDEGERTWCRRCGIDPTGKNPDEVRAQLKIAIPQFKAKFAQEFAQEKQGAGVQ